jgi:branched-chain amino acid transport system substrate-binding protein
MLAAHLRAWLRLGKAAIVERDGFWGNWAGDRISTTFTSLGGAVTSRRSVSTGQFTATLTAIQAENPDVIFYSDVDAQAAGLLSQVAHGLGMTGTIVAWNSFSEDEAVLADYAAQAGAAAEGDYAVMFYRRVQDMPGYAALNAAYQAAGFANFGDEATAWAAFPYDAVNILIDAMRRAQSADPRAIRDAVAGLPGYQGVVGAYRGFDAKGDVVPQWVWFERYAGGGWAIVRPSRVCVPIVLRSQE